MEIQWSKQQHEFLNLREAGKYVRMGWATYCRDDQRGRNKMERAWASKLILKFSSDGSDKRIRAIDTYAGWVEALMGGEKMVSPPVLAAHPETSPKGLWLAGYVIAFVGHRLVPDTTGIFLAGMTGSLELNNGYASGREVLRQMINSGATKDWPDSIDKQKPQKRARKKPDQITHGKRMVAKWEKAANAAERRAAKWRAWLKRAEQRAARRKAVEAKDPWPEN